MTARKAILAVVLCLAGGSLVCRPFRGTARLNVDTSPLALVDGKTREAITECLVVPTYLHYAGISIVEGRGAAPSSRGFVSHPFVYHRGEAFRPVEKGGGGVAVAGGLVAVGWGWGIERVLLVARGYEPKLLWSLWSPNLQQEKGKLEPIEDPNAAKAIVHRVDVLLAGRQILSTQDKELFGVYANEPLAVELTQAERAVVHSYLTGTRR
jgi:hypothetical protein